MPRIRGLCLGYAPLYIPGRGLCIGTYPAPDRPLRIGVYRLGVGDRDLSKTHRRVLCGLLLPKAEPILNEVDKSL